MEENIFTGLVPDTRSDDAKAKDWQHSELYSAIPVVWEEKTQFRSFPIRNQDGSSQCVAFSCALALGVNNLLEKGEYVELSPKYIYSKRTNKPAGGMWLQEAMNICCKYGAPFETTLKSDNINEQQANAPFIETEEMKAEALPFRGKANLYLRDIDEIAQVIARGQAPVICTQWYYTEWTEVPVAILPIEKATSRHATAIVDYTLYNGEKALVIQDSWGSSYGKAGLRILTESFINKRMTGAGYIIDLVIGEVEKPKFTFNRNMRKGYFGEDVKMLQKCLQYLQYFPANVDCTGTFGNVTERAVKALQEANKEKILIPVGLSKATGVVGPMTRGYLNSIFS